MMSFDLDKSLFAFAKSKDSSWKIRHAVEGVQIFGSIGSGKTSGSGRMLALHYLKAGFGGLILTVKPSEKALWENYCALAKRQDDLLIVSPDSENYFNFLDYEASAAAGDKSYTQNIVQVLKTVIRASEEKGGGKSEDPFWETALDMLIYNVIDLCLLAYEKIDIDVLFQIVQTIPKPELEHDTQTAFHRAFTLAKSRVSTIASNWTSSHTGMLSDSLTEIEYEELICRYIPEARLLKSLDQFFMESYHHLSDKTRSIVDFTFVGFLFHLLRDPVYSLFCKHKSSFTPESSREGRIILLDLPVKTHHKVGRDIQVMFKYIWQRAMERQTTNDETRPVFLWADEAQHFLHEHDAEFQATARSSRVATVYLSQNLPNYYANMGGAKADYKVKSFLGTLGTKIFHANVDIETNNYASQLIGDAVFEKNTETATVAGQFSSSTAVTTHVERILRPESFVGLRNGGKSNNGKVDAIMHVQGTLICENENQSKIFEVINTWIGSKKKDAFQRLS